MRLFSYIMKSRFGKVFIGLPILFIMWILLIGSDDRPGFLRVKFLPFVRSIGVSGGSTGIDAYDTWTFENPPVGVVVADFADSLLGNYKWHTENGSPAAGDTILAMVGGVLNRIDIGDLAGGGGGWTDDGTDVRLTTITDNVNIGVANGTGKLNVLATTEQLRLSYDATNYVTWTVAADGALTVATVDAAAAEGDINFNPDGNVGIKTAAPTVALDVTGAITASTQLKGATLLLDMTQDYLFQERSTNLTIQSQTAAGDAQIELYTKDGDGSDFLQWTIYAVGTPGDIATAREDLQIRWNASDMFEIRTFNGGTGTLRPLSIYTLGNTNQLKLEIDGSITHNSPVNFAADSQGDDDYEIALPSITALVAGLTVTFTANTANTDGATLEITSVGDLDAIVIADGASVATALATGEILAGQVVTVVFDGTNWQVTSRLGTDRN